MATDRGPLDPRAYCFWAFCARVRFVIAPFGIGAVQATRQLSLCWRNLRLSSGIKQPLRGFVHGPLGDGHVGAAACIIPWGGCMHGIIHLSFHTC